MKFAKRLFPVLVVMLLVSACGGAPATEEPLPTPTAPKSEEYPAHVQAAIDALAQTGIVPGGIDVKSVVSVEWPDACLGAPAADEMCAQVVTPGYRIVLEAGGKTYEYHTDLRGESVRLASGPGAIAGDSLMTWQREGGIAGFCDMLEVYPSGIVRVTNCKGAESEFTLEAGQMVQLQEWVNSFDAFEYEDDPQPTPPDYLVIRMDFNGNGTTQPTEEDIQAISAFAAELVAQSAQGAGEEPLPTSDIY